MSNFWERQLGGQPAQPQQPEPHRPQQQARPGRAWWQDEEPQYQPPQPEQLYDAYGRPVNMALQMQVNPQQYQGYNGNPPIPQDSQQMAQYIRKLRKQQGAATELTQEQMELIAEWELENEPKHQGRCPQCDSANFLPAGTVSPLGGGKTRADKCFDCNYSDTGIAPPPALGGSSGGRSGNATRQIDTGGAVASMYMKVGNGRAVPSNYMPRGN